MVKCHHVIKKIEKRNRRNNNPRLFLTRYLLDMIGVRERNVAYVLSANSYCSYVNATKQIVFTNSVVTLYSAVYCSHTT